eukprot:4552900-Amphidinium_carterae.2
MQTLRRHLRLCRFERVPDHLARLRPTVGTPVDWLVDSLVMRKKNFMHEVDSNTALRYSLLRVPSTTTAPREEEVGLLPTDLGSLPDQPSGCKCCGA